MGRTILGILAGGVAAWVLVLLGQFSSVMLHRPQAGVDLRDPQALAAHLASAPLSAMLAVVAGWMLGAFIGGWIAARIARHRLTAALTVGATVVLGVIANSVLIPHPLWMTAMGVALPIPLAWWAAHAATPKAIPKL